MIEYSNDYRIRTIEVCNLKNFKPPENLLHNMKKQIKHVPFAVRLTIWNYTDKMSSR